MSPSERFKPIDASMVVVASSHNPSILNPDFLIRLRIVPPEWVLAASPVCTFPFAQVAFENGLTITAEPNRLIFQQKPLVVDGETIFGDVASRYVAALPHVNYTAAGCNFTMQQAYPSVSVAAEEIGKRFLAEGPWRGLSDDGAVLPEVKFTLSRQGTQLTLGVLALSLLGEESEVAHGALRVSANYHRELGEAAEKAAMVADYTLRWRSLFADLVNVLDQVFA